MSATQLVLIRLASIALTVAMLAGFAGSSFILPFILSLGIAHHALALRYSASRIVALGRSPTALTGAALLTGAAVVLYGLRVSLVLCFGVHHAFNEGYAGRKLQLGPHGVHDGIFARAALLHGAAYVAVLRNDLGGLISPAVPLVLFAAAYASFATRLLRRVDGGPRELPTAFALELLTPLAVMISMVWRIRFLDVVLYHYALWTLLPMLIQRRSASWYLEYVGSSVVVTLLALATSPVGVVGPRGSTLFVSLFIFSSYLHITTSCALSDLHPAWILRRFAAPRVAATSAPAA